MTLLQQLDSIFSVANGLLFVLIGLIVVCLYVLINERKGVAVVLATTSSPVFEAEPKQDWMLEHDIEELTSCACTMTPEEMEQEKMYASEYYATLQDNEEEEDWAASEANAYYEGRIVPAVGYCLCNKAYNFTTNSDTALDDKWCNMIACSHCRTCNDEYDTMFNDTNEINN